MSTRPLQVVVASQNPVKTQALRQAFAQLFPSRAVEFQMVAAPSGVADQPMSDEETRRGAYNRVAAAKTLTPAADAWAGVEGGVETATAVGRYAAESKATESTEGMRGFAWIVIETNSNVGEARTASFPLPPAIAELIGKGVELGAADDIVFGRENSKQHEGAVGILTDGVIDRCALYQQAAVLAMIPMKHAALFA